MSVHARPAWSAFRSRLPRFPPRCGGCFRPGVTDLKVAARAGGATLAVAVASQLVVPEIATPLTIIAAVIAIVFELGRLRITIARRVAELESDIAQTQPLIELEHLLPIRHPLPAMREYAIAPDFALMLAQIVAEERPQLVVETGSGVSTLVIAYALEKIGRGRVIALEHDPAFARQTRAEIERHGLGAYASVIDAPLESIEIEGKTHRWYSRRALDSIIGSIDLVVDDGPPRYIGEMLRYASLPMFSRRMSRHGTFVLDVVGDEEREILKRWRDELPAFHQHALTTKKGNVIIRRV